MAEKEIDVLLLYDKSDTSENTFDFIKFSKFLHSLNKNISCKIFSVDVFLQDSKVSKIGTVVLFLQNADHISDTVINIRRKIGEENGVKLKIVTSERGKAKLWKAVKPTHVITYKKLDAVDDWYPRLAMFLYGKQVVTESGNRQGIALFMINDDDDKETKWFNRTTQELKHHGKTCLWTGDQQAIVRHQGEPIDCVVVVCRGEGNEVLAKSGGLIIQLSENHTIEVTGV